MNNLENFILKSIQKGIKDEAEKIFEEKKKEMVKELEKRKDEVIAGIVLEISRDISLKHLQDEIIITIRKEQENAN